MDIRIWLWGIGIAVVLVFYKEILHAIRFWWHFSEFGRYHFKVKLKLTDWRVQIQSCLYQWYLRLYDFQFWLRVTWFEMKSKIGIDAKYPSEGHPPKSFEEMWGIKKL